MEISEALKRFRQEFRLNQREVAAALGIPYQSYQGYEYGKNIPSAKIILKLSDNYNVTADYLLGRTDKPQGAAYVPTNSKNTVTKEDIKNVLTTFNQSAQALQQMLEKYQ